VNGDQFDQYLVGAVVICGAGAVLNLFQIKRRGISAILVAVAFVILGGTLFLLHDHIAAPLVYLGGSAVFLLLLADAIMRLGKRRPNG